MVTKGSNSQHIDPVFLQNTFARYNRPSHPASLHSLSPSARLHLPPPTTLSLSLSFLPPSFPSPSFRPLRQIIKKKTSVVSFDSSRCWCCQSVATKRATAGVGNPPRFRAAVRRCSALQFTARFASIPSNPRAVLLFLCSHLVVNLFGDLPTCACHCLTCTPHRLCSVLSVVTARAPRCFTASLRPTRQRCTARAGGRTDP